MSEQAIPSLSPRADATLASISQARQVISEALALADSKTTPQHTFLCLHEAHSYLVSAARALRLAQSRT